jgi:cytochrome c-type biogenesis protein CcmF
MLLVGTPGFLYLVKLGGFYIALAALWAGLAAYVGIELVFRRMTRGQVLHSRTPEFESIVSREFTFMLNNWGLLGAMLFVMIATTFPLISEGLWDEKITVGPPYYNAWMQPIGLAIFALMGIGSLFGWKKTSPELLRRAFLFPAVAFALAVIVHFAIGTRIGYPAVVWSEPIYGGRLGQALRVFNAYTPVIGISLCVFNAAVIFQEFFMLFRARRKGGTDKTPFALWLAGILPGFLYTMVTLPPQSRRRYGGYIVHLGLVLMFFGFTGHAWNIDKETSLTPGQAYYVSDYKLEYIGPRMEVDNTKRMIFADVKVSRGEQSLGVISPAKFFYKRMPEQPTTEVAMLHSARDDVYLVLGQVNPQTKLASLQIHINPLVVWIWFGCLVLIGGSVICLWPQLQPGESRVWAFARGSAAVATSVFIGFVIAATPVTAKAQSGTGSHAGTVRIESDQERDLFGSLRCMCGSCPRDLLSTCACDVAEATRQELRGKLRAGMTKDSIVAEYMKEFGTASLAIPPNTGALRLIYVAPLVAIGGAGVGLGVLVGKWRRRARERSAAGPAELGKGQRTARDDDYDKRLDDELKDLE